jgi:hypothetical protein
MSRPSIVSAVGIINAFNLTLDYLFLGRTHTLRYDVAVWLMEGKEDC